MGNPDEAPLPPPPANAAVVVVFAVAADPNMLLLPGVVGADDMPVFSESCCEMTLPDSEVDFVTGAVDWSVSLELFPCEPLDGDDGAAAAAVFVGDDL